MESLQDIARMDEKIWPQILIMEDEESVAKGLEMVLSDGGYTVDLAPTGHSALTSFHQKNFDLLIADLKLPDINGMDVIKQVKHDRPDTGVIVITGYSTVPSAVEAMKLGVHDYLSKPFADDEIMSVVQEALSIQKTTDRITSMETDVVTKVVPSLEPLPEDLERVREVLASFKYTCTGRREEIIPMLQVIQSQIGYIPEAAMEGISILTNAPLVAVYGIATFYEQFRLQPVGKHIVKVCRGTACHVKGAERILSEIQTRFHLSPGQTSQDRKLTLETVACFGSCAIAPVVVMDNSVKGRMNPTKTKKILEQGDQDDIYLQINKK